MKRFLFTLAFLLAFQTSVSAGAQYATVVAIPNPLANNQVLATTTNGAYVAGVLDSTKPLNAFLYNISTNTTIDLTPSGYVAIPQGVSTNGYVVGQTSQAPPNFEAVQIMKGTLKHLGFLPNTNMSSAFAVNSNGQIVGQASAANFATPFVYQNGTMFSAPGFYELVNEFDSAYVINNAGMIAGSQNIAYSQDYGEACSWLDQSSDAGAFPSFFACTPTKFYYPFSQPHAINNSGEVVGTYLYSQTCYTPPVCALNVLHAYSWKAGQFVDLGTLVTANSSAEGVNNLGQIVGFAGNSGQQGYSFFYDPANPSAGLQNLNDFLSPDSRWTIVTVNGINDKGQITGFGMEKGVPYQTAFIMTLPPGVFHPAGHRR